MKSYTGVIEVPFEELTAWIQTREFNRHAMVLFGIPRFNLQNKTLEINFAASEDTEVHPSDWAVTPKAYTEWQEAAIEDLKTSNK